MAENTKNRDELAKDRTDLANERTLLAYLRTALAFVITGGFILRFGHTNAELVIAVLAILTGIFIGGLGGKRFRNYKKKIAKH